MPTVWTDPGRCSSCKFCGMDMDLDPYCAHPKVIARHKWGLVINKAIADFCGPDLALREEKTTSPPALPAKQVFIDAAALRRVRGILAREIAMMLASCCLIGKNGKPRRETLEEIARPHVERLEASLAELDAALKGT
jgi:hypothetical protein